MAGIVSRRIRESLGVNSGGIWCVVMIRRNGEQQRKSVWEMVEEVLRQRRFFKCFDGDGLFFHLLD
jgi:hypothetical protein